MIGIRFKLPNKYDKFLNKILEGIDTSNYKWKFVEEEILFNSNIKLSESWYSDFDLKKIFSKDNYYLIFLNLQAFMKEEEIIISNFDTFMNSSCEILILVVDSIFVDIYVKSSDIINVIRKNAIKNNFEDIEFIYNDGSDRNVFCAI